MNDRDRAGEEALSHVLREARADMRAPKFGPAHDWDAIESRLMAKVGVEAAQRRALAAHRGPVRVWGTVIALVAAAALVALGVGHAGRSSEAPRVTLAARFHAPELIETAGVSARFNADDRAAWLVERESRVLVRGAGDGEGTVLLSLERGAIEAQVVPVASGEAFAVDVDRVRVAVHGTHLRVARVADHVVVDLTEGVVSIGTPPRVGSTYGTLVGAPAHIEFVTGDVPGSLRIDHDLRSVRAPVALTSLAASLDMAGDAPHLGKAAPPREDLIRPAATAARAPSGSAPPSSAALANDAERAGLEPASPTAPEDVILEAVRVCAAAAPHSNLVTVTVSSSLELSIGDDGRVQLARFDPPLSPETQTCASKTIYKQRFSSGGKRTIPLTLQR